MSNIQKFLDNGINWANENKSRFEPIHKDTMGCCIPETMALLNYLVSNCLEGDEDYLEIGAFCGRTVIAALQNNQAKAHIIDPFTNDNSMNDIYINIARYGLNERISVNHMTWQTFQASNKTLPTIGVYFNDGDHNHGATISSLEAFQPYLSKEAIIVVDDLALEPVLSDLKIWEKKWANHIMFRQDVDFFMGQAIFGWKS